MPDVTQHRRPYLKSASAWAAAQYTRNAEAIAAEVEAYVSRQWASIESRYASLSDSVWRPTVGVSALARLRCLIDIIDNGLLKLNRDWIVKLRYSDKGETHPTKLVFGRDLTNFEVPLSLTNASIILDNKVLDLRRKGVGLRLTKLIGRVAGDFFATEERNYGGLDATPA